jgi:cytochrome c biogenesis protein
MTETVERTAPLSTAPQPPAEGGRGPLAGLLRLWRQLTSMRTALLLLALLALAAIPGTVIPQRGLDPVKVDAYISAHPHLGPLLDHLSLFDVFAAPWFAAIYLLLFVSLVGCVVPRIRLHVRAMRKRPPAAPRHLTRLPASAEWRSDEPAAALAAAAHRTLRRGRWRADLRTEPDGAVTVCAEKGYLRETGNLLFHVALLLLLAGIAASGLYGYKGTVLVTNGGSFANARESYDVFTPSRLFHDSQLSPFSFTLKDFTASYQPNGEPLHFNAAVTYQSRPGAPAKPYDIALNHPLDLAGTKVFLVGHGYSLNLKVTDAQGRVRYDQATPFLPDNGEFLSHGVVKVSELQPTQLGLLGFFYPTYGVTAGGPTSTYPAPQDPVLSLAAYSGDLGLGRGAPQSVYSLDVAGMKNIGITQLTPGQSWKLPDGATVTFGGVDQWATFQVAHEPGKRLVLSAAILIIIGLIGSLRVRRRRFWLRAVPAAAGPDDRRTVVTAAGLARSDDGFAAELRELVGRLGGQAGDPLEPPPEG